MEQELLIFWVDSVDDLEIRTLSLYISCKMTSMLDQDILLLLTTRTDDREECTFV
jgi:hypothetical protein